MVNWEKLSLEDLAGIVSEFLRDRGIDTILVGGACVTIYSRNRYQSYDLDFVTYEEMKEVKKAMADLGFFQEGRHFVHEKCPWFVDFVSPPVGVGDQPIHEFEQRNTHLGTIQMLKPEDSVKDRLGSFFYWNDRQGLEQAVNICAECEIDLHDVELWAIKEGHQAKFQEFLGKLNC